MTVFQKNGNVNDKGEEKSIEDNTVGGLYDSVSKNGSGHDEGEEESVEAEAVGVEEEEILADEPVRVKFKLPRGKSVAKKRGQVFCCIYSSRCWRDCKKHHLPSVSASSSKKGKEI